MYEYWVRDMSAGNDEQSRIGSLMGYLAIICRVSLGIVFSVSGWSHLQNEMSFYADVRAYDLLAASVTPFVSIILPCMHVFVGAALLSNKFGLAASYIGSCALLVFFIAQGWIILVGKSVDCGCFGVLHNETVGYGTILRTLFALLIGAVVSWHYGFIAKSRSCNGIEG